MNTLVDLTEQNSPSPLHSPAKYVKPQNIDRTTAVHLHVRVKGKSIGSDEVGVGVCTREMCLRSPLVQKTYGM